MDIKENEIPELIRQGKDSEVVPVLYRKVLPSVKKYVKKHKGSKEDASDAFQEGLYTFYKQVIKNTFNDKYNIYGYVYRLSINRWINMVKKTSRMQLSDDISDAGLEQYEEADETDQKLVHDENILESMFSNIGEKCVELLTYKIYYNLPLEDIKLKMNFASEGAVKMQLQRCRQKLIQETEKKPALLDKLREINRSNG